MRISEVARWKEPVECKWIYIVKYRVHKSTKRYKVRLLAMGYTQTYDYLEAFALVAKRNSVRILISLATNCS